MALLWAQWEACQVVSKHQEVVQPLLEEKPVLMLVQVQVLLNNNQIHSQQWEAWVEWAGNLAAWTQL